MSRRLRALLIDLLDRRGGRRYDLEIGKIQRIRKPRRFNWTCFTGKLTGAFQTLRCLSELWNRRNPPVTTYALPDNSSAARVVFLFIQDQKITFRGI
jgi:hypothetical protein